jgi:hypothetical protein
MRSVHICQAHFQRKLTTNEFTGECGAEIDKHQACGERCGRLLESFGMHLYESCYFQGRLEPIENSEFQHSIRCGQEEHLSSAGNLRFGKCR